MRFSFASTLVVALAAETVVGSTWFSKAGMLFISCSSRFQHDVYVETPSLLATMITRLCLMSVELSIDETRVVMLPGVV